MFDISEIKFNDNDNIVFYSRKDTIIYKNIPNIIINDKKQYIKELDLFKHTKIDNSLLLSFGSDLIIVNDDITIIDIKYKPITKIFANNNTLVFGSILGDMFHYVIYDLLTQTRLCQTQSVKTKTLSSKATDKYIYSLLSNSQLICYNYSAEQIWKRFEPQYIIPGLEVYNGNLLYCCNNQIKITDGKNVESINVIDAKLNKFEGLLNNNAIFLCNNKKGLCCFNIATKTLLYEIKVHDQDSINLTLLTKAKYRKNIIDVLLFATKTHFGVVDIIRGSILYFIPMPRIKEIFEFDDLIVHTYDGKSHILKSD